jgi:hypothetical protein
MMFYNSRTPESLTVRYPEKIISIPPIIEWIPGISFSKSILKIIAQTGSR